MNDNYRKELREWENYVTEYGNNVSYLEEELQTLDNKMVEAGEAGDSEKTASYLEAAASKCEEIIEALHAMRVPKIVKNHHNYLTNYFIKDKQWLAYMLKGSRDFRYNLNKTKIQKLADKRDYFKTQANLEVKHITKSFNQRAKELDLPIPYSVQG